AGFRLNNAEKGGVLWGMELTFDVEKLPPLFARFTHQVIFSLADAIEQAELRIPFAPKDGGAYRLYLEGRAAMNSRQLASLRRARAWYRRALNHYRFYGPALAGLSRTMSMERLVLGIVDDRMLREALALADQAVSCDPFDGRGMRERGFSCLYLKR